MRASLKKLAIGMAAILLATKAYGGCAPEVVGEAANLGLVIERAAGSVLVVDIKQNATLDRITGLGDLSHASVVYTPDKRFAFVFGRDGGLTKIDLYRRCIAARIIQAGNSIGGAISRDGRLVAVSNYKPGGVRIFAADTLAPVADIPAISDDGMRSRVVGLVDAPDNRFIFTLFDAGEIWVATLDKSGKPSLRKFRSVGRQPYDALITADGRHYIAGLFGEDGMALLDVDQPDRGVQRILNNYGKGQQKLPVYKMPHLEGWALAGNSFFMPAVGGHYVLVVERGSWRELARIPVHGQPVFVMARPGGRHVWVNFAYPHNDTVQVIDVATRKIVRELKPGKAVLHMEFSKDGRRVWVSVRDEDRVDIFDAESFKRITSISANKPSGIFFSSRAEMLGL